VKTTALALCAALLPASAAQGFDVEQATRAYLSLLSGPARERSDAYFEGGYWLILWNAVVAVLAYGLLLATGLSARMRDWAERVTTRRWLQPMLYALPFTIAATLLLLPWSVYTEFFRERQYGLMNQGFGEWMGDQGIALLIGLVVNPLLFGALYAGIRRAPRLWWLIGGGTLSAFLLVGVALGPVFISPLFNTYTEMPAGPLRDRIVGMARAHGVPADNIYVSDASRQTKRISANVSGVGPTIRITLNDNLLNRTRPDEVAAVMGHEMGHYLLNHVWKLVGALAALLLAILFAVSRVAPALIRRRPGWRVRDVADPASAPLLLGLVAVAQMVATPLFNTIVRVNESEADAFGLQAARAPDGFAIAAIRLGEYRKLEPSAFEEAIFFDHPSGRTRVRMAMEWKKRNVPNATMATPTLAR
jgi:STE24 endopeptidase